MLLNPLWTFINFVSQLIRCDYCLYSVKSCTLKLIAGPRETVYPRNGRKLVFNEKNGHRYIDDSYFMQIHIHSFSQFWKPDLTELQHCHGTGTSSLEGPVVKSFLTVSQSGVHDANHVLMNEWPITIVEDVNLLEFCLTWLTLSWFLFMFCRDLEFSPNIMDFSFRQIQKSNSQILAQIKNVWWLK